MWTMCDFWNLSTYSFSTIQISNTFKIEGLKNLLFQCIVKLKISKNLYNLNIFISMEILRIQVTKVFDNSVSALNFLTTNSLKIFETSQVFNFLLIFSIVLKLETFKFQHFRFEFSNLWILKIYENFKRLKYEIFSNSCVLKFSLFWKFERLEMFQLLKF